MEMTAGRSEIDLPGVALRAFLRDRRSRIRPESLDLAARAPRRGAGLRREDVAELLGVTPLWYALFESGSRARRFSAAFLTRLRGVLQLNDSDAETLERLVVASGRATDEVEAGWSDRRWSVLAGHINRVSPALARARTANDAVRLVEETLSSVLASAGPSFAFLLDPRQAAGSCDRYPTAASSERCVMNVPIRCGDEALGTIRIESSFANAFCAAEASGAEILGVQLALSLTRLRTPNSATAHRRTGRRRNPC